MKSPGQLIAIASFTVIASSACAQEATPDTWINAIDWKSHRELRAELEATRNDSTSRASSANDFFVGRATSTKTRDQLRAERRAARDSAAHDALTREADAFGHRATRTPPDGSSGSRDVH
jgi:hypothetical protein